jgi:hypothetical protein
VLWGIVFGAVQAAAPLGFWWLDPATVYALSLSLIAAVYLGFAVADGRPRVVAVEAGIAGAFGAHQAPSWAPRGSRAGVPLQRPVVPGWAWPVGARRRAVEVPR